MATRIVVDGRIILPRMTGAGRYVVELVRRLPALDTSLDLVVLLQPNLRGTATAAVLRENGSALEYVDLRIASWRQWFQIQPVLDRLRPALYHYPFLDLPFTRFPSVATIYDLNPILDRAYFAGATGGVKRILARRIIGSTLRRSRAVFAISDATRRLVAEHYPRWARKVRTTLLGVDPEAFTARAPSPSEGARSGEPWGLRPYLLYVGVDRPHKNLPRLVGAYARFRSAQGWPAGDGPYLWLAGVGDGTPPLRARIADLRLGADVRLSGPLPEASLGSAYRGAIAFVYVSTSEGFGLPILEAFAANVPVIAANASSLPEVGGEGALYADPYRESAIADALERIWSSDDLRGTLIERGRRQMLALSWEATARATLRAYYDVLK